METISNLKQVSKTPGLLKILWSNNIQKNSWI